MRCNRLAVLAVALMCAGIALQAAAQPEPAALELDHVFVIVDPGAVAEAARLEEAGITVDEEVTEHTGQGTASRSVLFGGAYLELLWADSKVALVPEKEALVERLRAGRCAGGAGPSPFGVGLRRSASAPAAVSFPTTAYRAAWMSADEPPIELIDTSSDKGAVFLFIVPPYIALPSWEQAARTSGPARFEHRLGVARLTGVRVMTAARPALADDLASVLGLEFGEAETCLLEITFDGGVAGVTRDLRPGLPIVIHR
jgi:hypothetical protein